MDNSAEPDRAILQRIADALGVPVEWFFTGSLPVDADECLHIWAKIRTEEGRRRALEALRTMADEELEQQATRAQLNGRTAEIRSHLTEAQYGPARDPDRFFDDGIKPREELIQQVAAELVDFGMHVVPFGDDMAMWKVGGMSFTSGELLALARQFGLVDEPRGQH
ncbi:hypothetical protein FV228_00070 [Methylobacterium sp. WL18]|uniref:hypothetical protein n=1 Tax=Methylobacterium sp. WL18 TaxID=2603897 RepID=UPI0011CC44F8|nr:hypothetical protein [Methylobacterium sp. WL18]TXN76585.1 hypothetical protein FV228_00070 [Methylobacterium sp. WL18]